MHVLIRFWRCGSARMERSHRAERAHLLRQHHARSVAVVPIQGVARQFFARRLVAARRIEHAAELAALSDAERLARERVLAEERGALADFELRRRAEPRDITRIVLPHGSMLVLGPISNKYFTHSILRKEDSSGPRLSLTMRNVKTFLDAKSGRLFGQGVATKTLEELNRTTAVENMLLVASSAAGAAVALSPRFSIRSMKAKEALLFGTTYALTVYSCKLFVKAFVKRKEEREARTFFSKASVSGTKY